MDMTANVETPLKNRKWQILNATTLKFLAVVLMFWDHVHEMFASMGGTCVADNGRQTGIPNVSVCSIRELLLYTAKRNICNGFFSPAGE